MSGSAIKVVCRFRPQNRIENDNNGHPIVSFSEDNVTVSLEHSKGRQTFSFDRIFDWTTKQSSLYDYTARPIVEDVMRGYNGTVFAYGQTGSGKTFTMQGPDIDNPELRGILPRIVDHIFSEIMKAPSTIEFTVSVSYLEIYMEKIRDLLEPRNDNLPIHEDKIRGVYVKGLCAVYVTTPEETMQVMRTGSSNRSVTATNMNEESSRSHSLFIIHIHQKNTVDQGSKGGKLYLVDLAGSEMVNKTGATGQTLEEAKKINRSLTSLGMVINALTDGKSHHVPYRDSKLTRILQESLGGNSRTSLVINCSPSSYNEMETLSTLRFGLRAKKIENKAKINQELSAAELKRRLEKAIRLVVLLRQMVLNMKAELQTWRSGGSVPQDVWAVIDESLLTEGIAEAGDAVQEILARAQEAIAATASAAAAVVELSPESIVQNGSTSPVSEDLDVIPVASSDISFGSLEGSRSTPIPLADKSQYPEDLLERENELTDQLVEKETELAEIKKLVLSLQSELESRSKSAEASLALNQKLNDTQVRLNEMLFQNREMAINAETLLEEKRDLEKKLREAEKSLADSKAEENKEARMRQMLGQMMTELGYNNNDAKVQADNELKNLVAELESAKSPSLDSASNTILTEMRRHHNEAIGESKATISKLEATNVDNVRKIQDLQKQNQVLEKERLELEQKLSQIEQEYENLLDETIAKEAESREKDDQQRVDELHSKLEAQFKGSRETQQHQIEDLRNTVATQVEDLDKANAAMVEQKFQFEKLQAAHEDKIKELQTLEEQLHQLQSNDALAEKDKEIQTLKVKMTRQLADFTILRESQQKDLENRCLKVVELEMFLDDSRDEVQRLLRSQDVRKTKMVEAQAKELSDMQKQMVDTITTLKMNLGIAARKLAAREERIHNLEMIVINFQERDDKSKSMVEGEISRLKKENSELKAKLSEMQGAYKPDNTEVVSAPRAIRGGAGSSTTSIAAPTQPKTVRGGSISKSSATTSPAAAIAATTAAPSAWQRLFSSPSKPVDAEAAAAVDPRAAGPTVRRPPTTSQ